MSVQTLNNSKFQHTTNVYYKVYFVLGLQDAIAKNILVSDKSILSARVLAINATTGSLVNCAWWHSREYEVGGPKKVIDTGMEQGHQPDSSLPW